MRAVSIVLSVISGAYGATVPVQPRIGSRSAPVLTVDGLKFRDLNKNGKLDPYEDWRLPVDARVADLLGRMTVEEKAGLMVHASLMGFTGPGGAVLDAAAPGGGMPAGMINFRQGNAEPMDRPNPQELVVKRNVRYILVRPNSMEPPEVTATFSNGVQEIAERSRLGIPVAMSTDPRHTPSRRFDPAGPAGSAEPTPNISHWPEQIGFAAIGDANRVREFGRIAAKEYRAMGLSVSLSPMADVVTEPRWNRITGTFGEDSKMVAHLVKAYIEGFQGKQLGPESVLTVTKHFPGDGPVKGGYDPHNDYGKWQVYPGKNFDEHLIPFKAAFEAGTGAIMPGYAIPVGVDTVGMAFSKTIVSDMLRGKYRFEGLVVTDWLRNMPWGVEDLPEKQRQRRMVEVGCDQIGGDNDPKYIIELVKEGVLTEQRITLSAKRALTPMFQLGLFENPYTDPEAAKSVVASADHMRAGLQAQRDSIVVLKNGGGLLPLANGRKLYAEGFRADVVGRYGAVVADAKDADVLLIRVNAPFAVHPGGGSFFRGAHEGTLAYAGAENAKELEAIKRLTATGKPVIVCMYLERPAVLTEFLGDVRAVLAHFTVSDEALLDIAFGHSAARGKLPFDLPRDMASVEKQKEDVPHDFGDPLFKTGFGLQLNGGAAGR